jgi:hypothetical protein
MPQVIDEAKKKLEDAEKALNKSEATLRELRASIERSRAIAEARSSSNGTKSKDAPPLKAPSPFTPS